MVDPYIINLPFFLWTRHAFWSIKERKYNLILKKKNLKIHTGRFTFQAILYCPSLPLISIKKPISLRVMKLSRALCREDEVIPRERLKYNLERGLSITFEGIVV